MSRPRRAAKAVPDGYDQVVRLEQMRAARPCTQVWHRRPFWYGAHPVGRWTWTTGSRNDLRDVLDALDKLIALDHTLTATEEARPGWQIYLSPLRTWHAWRGELKLDATNASDLGAQIAEVERIESSCCRTTPILGGRAPCGRSGLPPRDIG